MAKKGRKGQVEPPKFQYPTSPHVMGLNWMELPVADPRATADVYVSIGFIDRSETSGAVRISIGGTLVHLVPSGRTGRRRGSNASAVRFELAVDQVEMKHKQLEMLGLNPGPLAILDRGSRAFEWTDSDGYVFRFVGPARRAEDPVDLD